MASAACAYSDRETLASRAIGIPHVGAPGYASPMEKLEHQSEKFGVVNLSTLAGVQQALKHLGYDPGKIDGIDGPNTKASVKSFQTAAGVNADGIAGPITKKALLAALEHASTPEGTTEGALNAAADLVKGLV
jgi:hypothetical protein